MSELRDQIGLWDSAQRNGDEIVLATVVRVEGSSYRKPGARMLLTKSGRRTGMISGGCLEAEVSRKAWWLTEAGPTLQTYGTFFDDDNPTPQGLGCGGTVHLLLEREDSAAIAMQAIRTTIEDRIPCALLTVIGSDHPEVRMAARMAVRDGNEILQTNIPLDRESEACTELLSIAKKVLDGRHSDCVTVQIDGCLTEWFAEYIAPPHALFVFGAGDDAVPVVEFAHGMGWHITVADARSHLATKVRFPKADQVVVLRSAVSSDNPGDESTTKPGAVGLSGPGLSGLNLGTDDAAVLMTHSYLQDRSLLHELLPLQLNYLGVLGPRLRTAKLIREIATETGLSAGECARRLHSPVGLDLGADTPVGIALSIVAEVQAASHAHSLRILRTDPLCAAAASEIAAKTHA